MGTCCGNPGVEKRLVRLVGGPMDGFMFADLVPTDKE